MANVNDNPVAIDPANPGTPDNPIPAADPLNIIPDVNTTDGATPAPVNVGAYIVDPEGEPLTFTATGLPPGMTIDPTTGIITGTLPADASINGPYTVTVTATDPDGAIVQTTVIYTVANLPPVAIDDAHGSIESGQSIRLDVLGNDYDPAPDNDPLSVIFATAANGSVVINPDGTLTYTSNPGWDGDEAITYTVSDGNGGTAIATVRFSVLAVPAPQSEVPAANDLPRSSAQTLESVDGEPILLSVLKAMLDGGKRNAIAIEGIVLDAVRGSTGSNAIDAGGIVVDTVEETRHFNEAFSGMGEESHPWDVRGLNSFSLKLAGGNGTHITHIETFVRGNTLIVELQLSQKMASGESLLEWQVQRADGRPRPDWLEFTGRDTLTGQRSAADDWIDLRIVGILRDGTTVTNEIRLNTVTGEVMPLKIGKSGQAAPPLFWEQLDRGYEPFDNTMMRLERAG